MKTKTYVLTLSRTFPKGHPREGEETEFFDAVYAALFHEHNGCDVTGFNTKIHTIRKNYDFWKKRIDDVNAGNAVLHIREWLGKPYASKQRLLFKLDKDCGIGVERLDIYTHNIASKTDVGLLVDGKRSALTRKDIAANDGLSEEDWVAWFSNPRYDLSKPMAIIHFTSFRYCK